MATSWNLSIEPVLEQGDAKSWIAKLDRDNSPMYDGQGETVELALAGLVMQMTETIDDVLT